MHARPSRRSFLARSILAFSAAGSLSLGAQLAAGRTHRAVPRARHDEDSFFEWLKVRATGGRGYALVAMGRGGNTLLLRGKDAAAIIDTKFAPTGACLRREAAADGPPLAFVINTHHHADHSGGNHAFAADLPVIAHANATDRVLGQMNRYISQMKEAATSLAHEPGAAADAVRAEAKALYLRVEKLRAVDFAPSRAFRETQALDVGGLALRLHHFGPGHTDNDVAVFIPDLNILHAGDLLFHGRHCVIDRGAGADTRAWRAALERVLALCNDDTLVVPGHGGLATPDALRTQSRYLDALEAVVAKARREGAPRDQIKDLAVPGFEKLDADRARPLALLAMFDELASREQPPAPPK